MRNLFFIIKIFLLLSTLIPSSHENIILKLIKKETNLYFTILCLGNPLSCNEIPLSLFENSLTVYKNFFYSPLDSSTSHFILQHPSFSLYSDIAEIHYGGHVTLHLGKTTIIKTHLHTKHIKRGFFGLALSSITPNHPSLIEVLFSLSNTSNVFYLNTSESKLTIGSYPKGYEQCQLNAVKYCTMERMNYSRGYSCRMEMMFYKGWDGEYRREDVGEYMWFSYGANMIYVPLSVMKRMVDGLFEEKVFKERCRMVTMEGLMFVECGEGEWKMAVTIVFANGRSVRFDGEELFNVINKKKYFIFGYDHEQIEWTFGYPFFEKFNVVFDLERDVAVFAKKK